MSSKSITTELIKPLDFYKMLNEAGADIGRQSVYNLIKRKGFPSVRMNKRYYVLANKVDEWFENESKKYMMA